MHILLIKMSSMGDVIHTLPALTDALQAIPDLKIDWVIEPAFADIPAWHPAVKKIIPISLRQWRKNLLSKSTYAAFKKFYTALHEKKYDLIIDAQGLLKSAIIAKLARGKISGYDKQSAREFISSYFYDKKYKVNNNQHAVTRVRELFANALQYPFDPGKPNYCIDVKKLPALDLPSQKKYFVFLHGTTWESKHYPDIYWQQLLEKAAAKNITVYLPWGTIDEKNRAEKFAAQCKTAIVLPKLTIAQIATLLKNATAVVGGDTGFTHLSAALSTPSISLYGPTDPRHIGALGDNQIHLSAQFPCAPCYSKTCWYGKKNHETIIPTCFTTINSNVVWNYLSHY